MELCHSVVLSGGLVRPGTRAERAQSFCSDRFVRRHRDDGIAPRQVVAHPDNVGRFSYRAPPQQGVLGIRRCQAGINDPAPGFDPGAAQIILKPCRFEIMYLTSTALNRAKI